VRIADLFVPTLCAICSRAAEGGEPLCEECDSELTRATPLMALVPGVSHAWAAGPHDGITRQLIGALKFKRRLPLARTAAEAMAAGYPNALAGPLIPVPPSPLRNRWRGFDPAAAIATALSEVTHVPLLPLLHRQDYRRQVGRRRSERLADPPRITAVAPPPPQATLVDDVITTGATLGACAAALRDAGCREILAIALARA
jgi:predicted amidophosphoribosyltransferase